MMKIGKTLRRLKSPPPPLDYTCEKTTQGKWEVWTPDAGGACIGGGATRMDALLDAMLVLAATGTALIEDANNELTGASDASGPATG